MSFLYEVSTDNIGLHIKNIKKDYGLDNSVAKKSSVTAADGKIYKTKIYNLEMIVAVGHRVKAKRTELFRACAEKILEANKQKNDSCANNSV